LLLCSCVTSVTLVVQLILKRFANCPIDALRIGLNICCQSEFMNFEDQFVWPRLGWERSWGRLPWRGAI